MRRTRSYRLALSGLLLGLMTGFAVLALKQLAARELIALLDDEVQASCPCRFEVDRVDISLLTLSATAHQARIVSEGKRPLSFARVEADFSLRHLLSRMVVLRELRLVDGVAWGVGPESVTFRFIDHLTAPIPPERDYPDRWRVSLERLVVTPSRFVEPLGVRELRGEGVQLVMQLDEHDNYVLLPQLETLRLLVVNDDGSSRGYRLGSAKGELYIRDNTLEVRDLRFGRPRSFADFVGAIDMGNGNALRGTVNWRLDSVTFALDPWIDGLLQGSGDIGGHLVEGTSQGALTMPSARPLTSLHPPLSFSHLEGDYRAWATPGDYLVEIPRLQADTRHGALKVVTPLSITPDLLKGELDLSVARIGLAATVANDFSARITLAGTPTDPEVSIRGTASNLAYGPLKLGAHTFNARYTDETVSLEFRAVDAGASFVAKADFDVRAIPTISFAEAQMTRFPLFGEGVRFTGKADLRGPLAQQLLRGSAQLLIAVEGLEVAATKLEARLEDGVLEATMRHPSGLSGSARALLDGSEKASLRVATSALQIEELTTSAECAHLNALLEYHFSLWTPWSGEGMLQINELAIGCNPFAIALLQPQRLAIAEGIVTLPRVLLGGPDSAVALSGQISLTEGLDLTVDGDLQLSLLGSVLPMVDDLRGAARGRVRLSGPFLAPTVIGSATINDGGISIETAGIGAREVHGILTLSQDKVQVDQLSGILNEGRFAASGEFFPLRWSDSNAKLRAQNVELDLDPDLTVVVSSELSMEAKDGTTTLSGQVVVDSAELTKRIDMPTIAQLVVRRFFPERQRVEVKRQGGGIDLDIALRAPRGVYLTTNLAGAELSGALRIGGTLARPTVEGKIETLAGWFRLRDRRFEVTFGELRFNLNSNEPTLNVLGETSLTSPQGETMLVLVEVRGPLSNPRIVLSSDRDLSQRELITLVTSGGTLTDQVLISAAQRELLASEEPLFEGDVLTVLRKIFRTLTRIDSLSLEPLYNTRRGVVEPAVVATKGVTRNLSLRAESTLGSAEQTSRVGFLYSLTRTLILAGTAETESTRQNTILALDLILSAFGRQRAFIDIEVYGETGVGKEDLLEALRLTPASRVPPSEIDRLIARIDGYYRDEGYFEAAIEAKCTKADAFCRALTLHVNAGEPYEVAQYRVTGGGEELAFVGEEVAQLRAHPVANIRMLEEAQRKVLGRLRREGYIGARVSGSYQNLQHGPNGQRFADLVLSVRPGKPVTFLFEGATLFTPEQFLETINLLGRRQPFGINTINILVENIERLYREQGYLFTAISYERDERSQVGRVIYRISIEESPRTYVSSVQLVGLDRIEEAALRLSLAAREDTKPREVFSPRFAIAEQMEAHAAVLRELLVERGFPEAVVTPVIVEDAGRSDLVRIEYRIDAGEPLRAERIVVDGLPDEFELPAPPDKPYSIPRLNRYVEQLHHLMVDAGYLGATVQTNFDQGTLQIIAEAGQPTLISGVQVEGTVEIEPSVVLENLPVKPGDRWEAERLAEGRARLLKLGVFSRVELEPVDGVLDGPQEVLLVRVNERPLQTLEIGGGANSEFGAHLFGEFVDRGTFGDGRSMLLRLDGYYDPVEQSVSQGVAGMLFTDPTFLGSDLVLTEDLRYQKLDVTTQEYNLNRLALVSFLSPTLSPQRNLVFGHTIFQDDLTEVTPGAILSDLDHGVVTTSFLSGAFALDYRDDPVSPTLGYFFSGEIRLASEALLSDSNFFAVSGRGSYFMPLYLGDVPLTLAFGSRIASAWEFGGTEYVPITERYYLGGRTSVRGFRENSLGPLGDDGAVIGGDLLLQGTAELRYPLNDAMALLTFFDIGNVFLKSRSVSLGDLRQAAGIGIRYLSPLGPIGFDLGMPLDERAGEPSMRLHFSVGSAF